MAQKDQAVAPKEGTSSVLPPGVSASGRVVGDYYIPAVGEEESRPKQRGYTTRAKEEARRTEVKFTGLVRRWEKRWVNVGHLKVLRWEREDGGGDDAARASPELAGDGSRKRQRQ